MGFMFFMYTMAIIAIALLAATTNMLAYAASWKRVFLLAAIGFLFYFLDELPIFLKDFITQPSVDQGNFFYMIYQPLYMLVTGGGFLGCLWLTVCHHLDERRIALLVAPIALFAALSISALVFVPEGRWQQLCFYGCRQLMMVWIAWYGLHRLKGIKQGRDLGTLHRVLVGIAVLAALMMAEDVVLMVIIDPFAFSPSFPVYTTERNFVENALFFWLAYLSVKKAGSTLRIQE